MAALHSGRITERLVAYLNDEAHRPFDWRFHNCGHFVGGWVAFYRGIDRWEIDARAERDARLRLCGELPFDRIAERAMVDYALPLRVDGMTPGDIVMMHKNGGAPWRALGIALPPFVALLAEHGIFYTRATPRVVWALQ